MEFKKILLPFDGSDRSIDACQYSLMLAKMSGAEVTILNCYELLGDMHSAEIGEKLFAEILSGIKKRSEELLKEAGDIFAKEGVFHLNVFPTLHQFVSGQLLFLYHAFCIGLNAYLFVFLVFHRLREL